MAVDLMKITVVIVALALRAPVLLSAQGGPLAGLDRYVEDVLRDWEAPGVALAVVKGDSVVYARGYGVREVGRTEPVDEHTLFAIASTTKAFTAATVALLVDEGRVHWDDRVIEHLPGFQLSGPYVTRELRVRDLLSHRSGLPRGDRLWYASPYSRQQVLHRVRALEPQWSFRARYGYQNIMFITAGQLVGAVSGRTWDAFVRERLLEPLGMTATTTTIRDLSNRSNVVTPHVKIEGKVTPIPWRNFDNLGGAGNLNSSVADMAQWIRLQLSDGTFEERRLLSDSVIQEMHTAQTVIRPSEADRTLFPETHFRAYGLGWFLQDYRGRKIVRHGGSLDGMRTHVLLVPEVGLGIVAMTNINESSVPQAIVWRIADRYLGVEPKDWNQMLLTIAEAQRAETDSAQAERESARKTGTQPSRDLHAYVGTYRDPLYGDAVVELRDGYLVLRVGPHFVGDLSHWHFDTFRASWRDRGLGRAFVRFELDAQARVASVDVGGFGEFSAVPSEP